MRQGNRQDCAGRGTGLLVLRNVAPRLGPMRKVNPELWVLLLLVVIAAMLNFVGSSQPMTLMFYFLPTLYSAYRFGRAHATMTAVASIILVVSLTYLNPKS